MLRKIVASVIALVACVSTSSGQTGQWTTFGHDPQRSGYASDEHAFTPENVRKMGLRWKTVLPNEPLSMNGLTAPLIVRGVPSQGGSRNLVLVAGSSDHLFALDAETGELAWKVDFQPNQKPPEEGGWLCPMALNDTPVIDAQRQRVFVIASDGRLYTLALSDGHPLIAPIPFVPPYSKMWSLNYSDGALYASLSQDCNHANSGVAAMNPDSPGRPVTRFYSSVNGGAGIWGRGGVSVGFDGFLYGATGDAPFDLEANAFGESVLRLKPHSLELAGYYAPAEWQYLTRRDLDFTATPVVFRWHGRVLTAVGGKEGAIYLTDTAVIAGPDHHTAAYISPRYTNAEQTFERNGIWGEMTVWNDGADTWLYVPSWGMPTSEAHFSAANGEVKSGSLMAFRVVAGASGSPTLQPAWISSDIAVPDPAAVAGGVVFVLGTGENTQQVNAGDINQLLNSRETRNSGHAILHALDAHTGKELWSSGASIDGWTHFSGIAVGDGKVFATTHDGAVYAFEVRSPNADAPRTIVVPGPKTIRPQPQAATAPPTAMPSCGEASTLFRQRCALCHGENGRGMTATHTPDFTDAAWQQGRSDKALLDAITHGTDRGMPAFAGQLSTTQIEQLGHCVVRGFAGASHSR